MTRMMSLIPSRSIMHCKMEERINVINSLLSRLRLDNDPVVTLKELKVIVGSLNSDELQALAENTTFACIFDNLNANDKEQISLACDVLSKLLSSLKPIVILDQFQIEICRGLKHPDPLVKKMVLRQLRVCFSEEHLLKRLDNGINVTTAVISLLTNEDLGVIKASTETLLELSKSQAGVNLFFSPPCIQELTDIINQGDVIRFRMYEVLINMAKYSPEVLKRIIKYGLLLKLLSEYQQNDILLQLNCLEMLSELATTDYGLMYLEENGIVNYFEKKLHQINNDPLVDFLLPGLIKFFGNIGYVRPKQIYERHISFINLLFGIIQNNDRSHLVLAIETVSIIGSTVDGKHILEKFSELMKNYMRQMGNLIVNAPSEIRIKALNSVSSLLELKIEEQTVDTLTLTQSWFLLLSSQPLELILNVCHQPFADLRCAALGVLRSLSNQPWCQSIMNNHPGFFEYLLDRSTEPDKEGKELKHEIVSVLVNSPTSQEIFGNVAMLKLKEFFREGPFYVEAQAEIAIEGAT